MRTRLFSANVGHYDNPKNFTHQHMTATENFHLVKRVMSIKSSVRNDRPPRYKHLNNCGKKLPVVSTQTVLKSYDTQRENKALLSKMLKIMERPLISKTTAHNPLKLRPSAATMMNRSHSRASQEGVLKRAPSASSMRSPSSSGRHTPTSGVGPASLNQHFRKKSALQIQKQNLKMVNQLLQVKPNVPRVEALKKWSDKHDTMRNSIGQVRYGTPKPLPGIQVKMSIERRHNRSRRSSVSSSHSASRKVLQLVPKPQLRSIKSGKP